jgi:hypothetical protein
MGRRIGNVKAFLLTTRFPDGSPRPSGLWELTHPRQAGQFWADLQEQEDSRIAAEVREEMEAYREQDARITDAEAERERREWQEEPWIQEDGYPEYGFGAAGFRGPAPEPEPTTDITFTRGADGGREFEPPKPGPERDRAEYQSITRQIDQQTHGPEWDEPGAREQLNDIKAYLGRVHGQEPERKARDAREEPAWREAAIDEGRFAPTEYDLGITDDPQDELGRPREPEQPGLLRIVAMGRPGEREIRGEPDPYDPLNLPGYACWARGIEGAE